MKPLSDTVKASMGSDPDIAKALREGWKLADCQNGRNASQRMGSKIGIASHRYGPKSQEVADAIAEANRVSVMLTSARAAYNRILRYPPPESSAASVEVKETPPPETDAWRPQWSKSYQEPYRELQNIPEHWGLNKVVLIWFSGEDQRLRVFSRGDRGFNEVVLEELTGSEELPLRNKRKDRWDYDLTPDQYDRATRNE